MASVRRPLVIAHRGASGYRPEHTRSAYELAISCGADAVEPDLVPTRDGVLVVRHENELSGTTDVAQHPQFAARRITKTVSGRVVTGWFTEDFTWDELRELRAVERLPGARPGSSAFDGTEPLLRLEDVLALLDAQAALLEAQAEGGPPAGLVAELKHAAYFDGRGLPLHEFYADALGRAGWASDDPRLSTECFELTVLETLRSRSIGGRLFYALELRGGPADRPSQAYDWWRTDAGLASLVGTVDGISVDLRCLVGRHSSPGLVHRAHAVGLEVFGWTLRSETEFLPDEYRRGGGPGSGSHSADGDWRGWFEAVMHTGIDAVFTDQPDLALAVRGDCGE